ncbi:MAG: response regulator transcription factor [Bryobacterales bacterium]|nr:response regulator transcription factor [Bryobacterales bacterium]MBV9399552.1 response regulator transcription factor [Bryobacterales bacterium]
MILEGLIRLLEPEYHIIGAVRDGRTLAATAVSQQPDLIAADPKLLFLNEKDFEVLREIRTGVPQTKLLCLSAAHLSEQPEPADAAILHVSKSAAKEVILAAVAKTLGTSQPSTLGHAGQKKVRSLTVRQRSILQMIANGKSSKEMAHALNISVKTIEFHRANLRCQLGVRTTAELTKKALQQGL